MDRQCCTFRSHQHQRATDAQPRLPRTPPLVVIDFGDSYRAYSTFTDPDLLEGELPASERLVQAAALDDALRFLGSAEAQLNLVLGRGLGRMTKELSIADLGHSRSDDWYIARYGFGWSFGRQLRWIAEKLAPLPVLSAAYTSGQLPWTKVRELVAIATPGTEAGWACLAAGRSVRELRLRVAATKAAAGRVTGQEVASVEAQEVVGEGGRDPVREKVTWLARPQDAANWLHLGKPMVRTVVGQRISEGEMLEYVLAETRTAVHVESRGEHGRGHGHEHEAAPKRGTRGRALSERVLARLGRRHQPRAEGRRQLHLPRVDDASTAAELNTRLVQLAQLRRRLEAERARLLVLMHASSLYRELGHDSLAAYAADALGLGDDEVQRALTRVTRLASLPTLQDAWHQGDLAPRIVAFIERLATRETEAAWIAHAKVATFKRFEIEAEHHLRLRLTLSPAECLAQTQGRPQTHVGMHAMMANWQRQFGVEPAPKASRMRLRAAAGSVERAAEGQAGKLDRAALKDPFHRLVRVSVWAEPEVAAMFGETVEAVRKALGGRLDDGQCVTAMLFHFAETHCDDQAKKFAQEHPILQRDGWMCTAPHCRAQASLRVHHVIYRSRRGPTVAWNLTALCHRCHLRLIHEGRMRVVGRAPLGLVWTITIRGSGWEVYRDGLRPAA